MILRLAHRIVCGDQIEHDCDFHTVARQPRPVLHPTSRVSMLEFAIRADLKGPEIRLLQLYPDDLVEVLVETAPLRGPDTGWGPE